MSNTIYRQDEIEPPKLSPLKNVEIITDWAAECEDISNNSYWLVFVNCLKNFTYTLF